MSMELRHPTPSNMLTHTLPHPWEAFEMPGLVTKERCLRGFPRVQLQPSSVGKKRGLPHRRGVANMASWGSLQHSNFSTLILLAPVHMHTCTTCPKPWARVAASSVPGKLLF